LVLLIAIHRREKNRLVSVRPLHDATPQQRESDASIPRQAQRQKDKKSKESPRREQEKTPVAAVAERPEHDPEKACPGLDPGWVPVFGKVHAPATS
jgi:hypothetical protein